MLEIGKYRIRGLLGRGSMSKVYKVELPVIGKIAALKLLEPDPVLIDLIGKLPLENPDRPSKFNPDLDDAWDAYIMRSINPDPENRFAGATEMLNNLDKLDAAWQQKKEKICRVADHDF